MMRGRRGIAPSPSLQRLLSLLKGCLVASFHFVDIFLFNYFGYNIFRIISLGIYLNLVTNLPGGLVPIAYIYNTVHMTYLGPESEGVLDTPHPPGD